MSKYNSAATRMFIEAVFGIAMLGIFPIVTALIIPN